MKELPKGYVDVELEIDEIFAMKLDFLSKGDDSTIFLIDGVNTPVAVA